MTGAKTNRHYLPAFTVLLVLSLLVFHGALYSQQGKKSEKLKQTKERLEQEIKYTTELLEKTQKSKQVSLNKVKILRKQIKTRENLINAINQELQEMDVQLTYESMQVERMSKQLQDLKSEYARMIAHAYRTMNGHNKLMFIFSAKDFNQAYQRMKYYQQYSEYRKTQAARIQASQQQIDRHRHELATIRDQKIGLVGSQTKEKQKLDLEREENDKNVKGFSSQEKQLMATLKTKQQAAAKLNSEIEKAINAEIRASEERLRKKESMDKKNLAKSPADKAKAPASTGKLELTPVEVKLSSSFSANQGKLPWPCDRGFISESFGEHAHPVLKHVMVRNNGIDIMTDQGAPVRSVFSGRISKVMSFQQLNKVVIIRHGEYLTVYSNLGDVIVKEGDEVKARQIIGKVEGSAEEQRQELHFELWKGKTILDPESWLATK